MEVRADRLRRASASRCWPPSSCTTPDRRCSANPTTWRYHPLRGAAHLPPTPVQLAFVLAVVGFGTKVGLFPVHTWLPDAHSEAPTPVSALLSGSLLAVSFYAILRFYQIAGFHWAPASRSWCC